MAPHPIISAGKGERFEATGASFAMREWAGSGPASLHVHHSDDEAWHVLAGTLRFRFADRDVTVGAGSTVFVPAGTPHTFEAVDTVARYLVILPPRLLALIESLQGVRDIDDQRALYRRFDSELVE